MTNPEVIIMGMGYIGLPTAALIARNSVSVHGVDIQDHVIDTINEGKIHIQEPQLEEIVHNAVSKGTLRASKTPVAGNVYLIVVPTPFKGNHEPDISFVKQATEAIIPLLKEGDLYIIESTSPVGTTEKMADLIYNQRKELKDKLHIAYCPERVLPGNVMHELVHNDRVIGGLTHEATEKVADFYSQFVEGDLYKTNAKTAEMCKLVENSSRDVQIAFANELSLICDKAGIDVWELIELANRHPRVNILRPGAGVGGHCIAVDPYFIVSDFPLESQLISRAREINNYKAFWVVEKIKTTCLEFEVKNGRKPILAIMGLAFKPNIDDLRESPAMYIAQKIHEEDIYQELFVVEPNISSHPVFELSNYEEAMANSDLIAYLVAHEEFKSTDIRKKAFSELDFCGIRNVS